jgi:DNA-binding MarR family transcriptional regulator
MTTKLIYADCVCFNLRKAARITAQVYDQHLAPVGLKNTQFSLLNVVATLGPLSITDLAGQLVMDRTTLTRNLKPVERDGLIEVVAGEDARTRHVQITTKGRKTLNKALPLWEDAQQYVLTALGQARWRSLLRELKGVLQAVKVPD